jgi:hypothetical protein
MNPQLWAYLRVSLCLMLPWPSVAQGQHATRPSSSVSQILLKPRNDLTFEVSVGQTRHEMRFASRSANFDCYLTPSEAILHLPHFAMPIRLHLLGSSRDVEPVGKKKLASYSNYLIGNDRRNWRTHVPQFGEVWYPGVYPGIDLVYYGSDGQLEYDFVVAPHSRADRIAFSVAGIDRGSKVRIDAHGDLVLPTAGDHIVLQRPLLFQGDSCLHADSSGPGEHGACRPVAGGKFAIHRRGVSEVEIGFELPAYDHSQTLVIDPVVAFSGTGRERAMPPSCGTSRWAGSACRNSRLHP